MKIVFLALVPILLCGETLSLYKVSKMHCPLCTVAVKKSLNTLDGVRKAEVRLNTREAKVWHDDRLSDQKLRSAIAQTGYEGELLARKKLPQ